MHSVPLWLFSFFSAEELVGFFECFGWPLAFGLQFLEVVQLLDADDGPALRESAAAEEWSFFTLPDNKEAFFAFMTANFGRLGRRLGRQDVAILIDIEDGLAIGISAAAEERAESAVLIHHRLAADCTFKLALLFF